MVCRKAEEQIVPYLLGALDSSEMSAIDAAERRALTEVAEHWRLEAEWYARIDMPFTRETEDDYLQPDFDAFNEAESALMKGEARTPAGLAAKIAFLWQLRGEIEMKSTYPDYLDVIAVHHCGSDEVMVAAWVRDATALSEWHVAPGSDTTNGGSDA